MKYFFVDGTLFYYKEVLQRLSWLPTLWHPEQGLGASALVRLWYDYPIQLFIKLYSSIDVSWWMTDKILWMLPIFIGIISSWKLARFLLRTKLSAALASIIYVTNTYFLLLFGGGQLGVALGYGLAPYVLLKFIKMIDSNNVSASLKAGELKEGLWTGLWLALLVIFDLRFAYLIIGSAILYYLFNIARTVKSQNVLRRTVPTFIIPGVVAASLHMFWILPIIMGGGGISGLGGEYTGPGMLKFLSVADFSHALSLLHPNWPENLFGRVYFLQPEFLILPVLAFASLLFLKKTTDHRQRITFFALLVLMGVFFAKGVNDPFGGIFNWCFIHVPGFIMFRDPTKFYLFIALGYAVLIPYFLQQLHTRVKKIQWIFFIVFILFWCFTIRPLFLGQLTGNFRPQSVPREYIQLKDMLVADETPSRTLWMPSVEKFAYASDVHPSLSATDLFKNVSISEIMNIATSSAFLPAIAASGVRYVIVPQDVSGTMFMADYKTDVKLRQNLIAVLQHTTLKQDTAYQHIAVFENTRFSFTAEKPPNIDHQQQLSILGLFIGIVFLCIWIMLLILLR